MAAALRVPGIDVGEYLTKKQKPDTDLSADWAQVEQLYNKKLWHQLTLKLAEFVKNPDMQKGDNLIDLYENFITTFENKINPLTLIEIVSHVTHQYKDKKQAVAFLETMEPKVKANDQAWTLCKVLQGQIYLDTYEDMENTARIISELENTLEDVDGVTPVHGKFYKLASDYYRLRGPLSRYYRAGLRYVGCCGGGLELPTIVRMSMAKSLALAAVFAEDVYDLNELLAHPILDTLESTKDEWAMLLVKVVARGDLEGYLKLRASITPVNMLEGEDKLKRKIAILCLMEMAYNRSPSQRTISFAEISAESRVEAGEVELLIMKAMAEKLIRGSIDQVSSNVTITWVKPRALTRAQICSLASRLADWCALVNTAADMLESTATDVLTY